VFAQEFYSLFMNKTLELYLNTMENIVFEFSILHTIYSILYIVYNQTKAIKNFYNLMRIHKKIQWWISKQHLSIARDRQG
jgi:hypothetical protein